MSIQQTFKRLLSAVAAGAMACTMLAGLPVNMLESIEADAAGLCTVNTNKTYQRIRGFGGMNLPEWQGYDLTDAQIKTVFGNGDGQLGLSVLRIYVSDDSNAWKNVVPTAKGAQALGATIFATPWNPPSSMRSAGGGAANSGKYVLNNGAEAQYAQHLNSFVKYVEGQGINLYSISVQNEPDFSQDWTYWSPERTTNFIANYGQAVKAGTNARLMSPETFQYGAWGNGRDYYNNILNNSKALANVDLFGTHFYGTPRAKMDFPALESSGKEIWMTEVYVPNSDADSANRYPEALEVSENIHNGLVVGNMSVYTWWYIRRSYGLIGQNDGQPTKRGWCMAQYSKFVRPGDVRIDATESPADGLLISAFKHSDTQIEIVAINKGSSDQSQQFSVDGRTITNVDRYRTSENENAAKTADLAHDTSTYWANLPAKSVSTFVVTLTSDGKDVPEDPDAPIPAEPITPDANGCYYHDTFEDGTGSWEAHGASSLTLSGRVPYEGTNALLVQDRGGAWQGVQKALDATTFKAGESYSFSVNAYYDGDSAPASQDLLLSVQYTDAAGETKYGHIAQETAYNGHYVQLANTSFTLPEGGSNFVIYVETAEGTDNFYIDEAIVAVKGTVIKGAEPYVPETTQPTTETTQPTTQTTQPTTGNPSVNVIPGDVNGDNKITVADLAQAKHGLLKGFASTAAEKAADVDGNGTVTVTDIIQIQKFLLRLIDKFTVAETPQPATEAPQPVAQPKSMAEFTAECAAKVSEYDAESDRTEQPGVQYGTIQSGTYYSTTCNREKPFHILLPANYDTSRQYPVLYVMHGYWENQDRMIIKGNGTMYTRQLIGNAIAKGEAEDMIVVFPYIYSSATQPNCTAMDDANNAAYDNFINDLTKDLMPYIEQHYSVKTGRDNTAITGFSMGGRESLLIGMQRSDLFGYVGAICPAPGVTGAFKWDSGKEPYLVMITAGSNDRTVYDTPRPYHEKFDANGVPNIWHYVNGGYHGDNSIHAHLYNFCRFVFKATK